MSSTVEEIGDTLRIRYNPATESIGQQQEEPSAIHTNDVDPFAQSYTDFSGVKWSSNFEFENEIHSNNDGLTIVEDDDDEIAEEPDPEKEPEVAKVIVTNPASAAAPAIMEEPDLGGSTTAVWNPHSWSTFGNSEFGTFGSPKNEDNTKDNTIEDETTYAPTPVLPGRRIQNSVPIETNDDEEEDSEEDDDEDECIDDEDDDSEASLSSDEDDDDDIDTYMVNATNELNLAEEQIKKFSRKIPLRYREAYILRCRSRMLDMNVNELARHRVYVEMSKVPISVYTEMTNDIQVEKSQQSNRWPIDLKMLSSLGITFVSGALLGLWLALPQQEEFFN